MRFFSFRNCVVSIDNEIVILKKETLRQVLIENLAHRGDNAMAPKKHDTRIFIDIHGIFRNVIEKMKTGPAKVKHTHNKKKRYNSPDDFESRITFNLFCCGMPVLVIFDNKVNHTKYNEQKQYDTHT